MSCGMPRAARAQPYLLGLRGERAHLPSQIHVAQVQGAIAVDAIGVVASANEHGAEQCAEVEAVPFLALEHRGRGVQVAGLVAVVWSAELACCRPPLSAPLVRGQAPGPKCRLDPS